MADFTTRRKLEIEAGYELTCDNCGKNEVIAPNCVLESKNYVPSLEASGKPTWIIFDDLSRCLCPQCYVPGKHSYERAYSKYKEEMGDKTLSIHHFLDWLNQRYQSLKLKM